MIALGRALAGLLLLVPTGLLAQGAEGPLAIGRTVAARYDSAFAVLVARAEQDSSRYRWLLELAQFKRERLGWGVESEGRVLAVTPARRDAWLVVVPATDPAYGRMGSILESDPGATVVSTRVKEDSIALAWAAVFLAFELSHLRDEVLDLLPPEPKSLQLAASSRRAYAAELAALRALAGPAMDAHLDSVITATGPKTAVEMAEGILPVLRSGFDTFDALVSSQKALTEREEQRRAGVYAAALLLRLAEQRFQSDEEFAAALRCMGGCRQ